MVQISHLLLPEFPSNFELLQGLNGALDRALYYYNSNEEGWIQLAQKVMNLDYSWDQSASQYEEIYEKSRVVSR